MVIVQNFCERNSSPAWFESRGQLFYFSCVEQVGYVIGNFSSCVLEAPSFNNATIDVGIRKADRLKSSSVVDCFLSCHSIFGLGALSWHILLSFKNRLKSVSFLAITGVLLNPPRLS